MSACYRSNNPAVIEAWEDSNRRYRECHERIAAFRAKYGGEALVFSGHRYRLAALDRDEIPEGGEKAWREDRKLRGWVPRRSTKEGKAIAKEFDACTPGGELGIVPGLPRYVHVKGPHPFQMQGPAVFGHDGYVWASWQSADHEDVIEGSWGKLDTDLWEQCKRSELEAAREAMEAEREVTADA